MTTQITEYSATETALADLASRFKGVVFDVATTKGMADARKGRAELRTLRTSLEDKRKELKASVLERGRLIDGEAKRITAELESLETPISEQIRNEETRKEREKAEKDRLEKERVDGIHQAIASLNSIVPSMAGKGSQAIQERAQALQAYDVAEWAAEKIAAEAKARADADAHARARIDAAERKSRERIEAAEQEYQAKREAEQQALMAARDRLEADRKAEADRQRQIREAEEDKQREIRRQQIGLMDARTMLETFVNRYGKIQEFAPLIAWILKYLAVHKSQRRAT